MSDHLQQNKQQDPVKKNNETGTVEGKTFTPPTPSIQTNLDQSPLMIAQKKRIDKLFNGKSESNSDNLTLGTVSTNQPTQLKKEEEEKNIQMKDDSFEKEPLQMMSNTARDNKLPENVQAKMEGSFNTDFSDVSIHNNSANAEELNALAYTQGTEIHFAPGQYNPESQKGPELLGHELTHVVQQRQGNVKPTTQLKGAGINNDAGLEQEADEMGKKAAAGITNGSPSSTGGGIQLKSDYYFQHRILKNESLLDIAVYYNVPVDKIKEANILIKEDKFTEGTVINIPSPESVKKDEKNDPKPDKEKDKPDYFHLTDKKNQVIEVTASDFDNFLQLYHKFSSAAATANPQQFTTDDLKNLKYLLGPIQDQNPWIKQYVEKAQSKFSNETDKVLAFIKELWNGGFLGKAAIILPAAVAATGVAIPTISSIKLTIEGKNNKVNDLNLQIVEELLKKIEFKKENKDYSGSVTTKPVDFSISTSVDSDDKNQIKPKVGTELKFNKSLDESDRKELDEAKFTDKTVWYVLDNTRYYDTITLRHYIHKDPSYKIASGAQVVKAPDISTVRELLQSVHDEEEAKSLKVIHLKDKQTYSYAQIMAMFAAGAIDGKDEIAKVGSVKAINEIDILAKENLYKDEFMTLGAEARGGLGFNKGNTGLNYSFGGSLSLSFPGKKSDSLLKLDYNQDQHYQKLGTNLDQWSQVFLRDIMFKVGQNFKFDLGDFHTVIGADASYKHSYEKTTNETTGKEAVKESDTFSIDPHVTFTMDKNRTNVQIYVKPEFMWQDGKFKSAVDIGLTGLKLSKDSYIKIDMKLKDGKLDTANFNLIYMF